MSWRVHNTGQKENNAPNFVLARDIQTDRQSSDSCRDKSFHNKFWKLKQKGIRKTGYNSLRPISFYQQVWEAT